MTPRKYPSKKKTTTPEGYREYKKFQMRDVRERERKKADQNKAKIEEMTYQSFGDMQHDWCIQDRMLAGDTEDAAKAYCDQSQEATRRMIALDLEDEGKRETVKSIIEKVNIQVSAEITPFNDSVADDYEELVQYCIQKRTFYLGSLYSRRAIDQFCREMLPKTNHLVRKAIIRQKMRETDQYPSDNVSEEYEDRVYSLQAILGVHQATVERYVKADMISEGKFADLSKRSYNRISVGDLFGKTQKQIIAATFPEQTHYGKDAKAREEFQKFKDEQRVKGVRMPSPILTPSPSKRSTVGNLYGKTRKEILDMNKEDEK